MELLFESRRNLVNIQGPIHFVQYRPRVHPEPLLRPDTFVDGRGALGYGTVLNESGRLRLWYQACPSDWPGNCDIAAVAYAESEDGYHWVKRPLGQVEHGPGPNHLCDLSLHSPSIFVDPDSPPSHRYRATGCGRRGFLARDGIATGYYTAHSADGLHWELDGDTPQWEGRDVITSIYHPGRRGGVVAMKHVPWVHRMRRRTIHTAGYEAGRYGHSVSALVPDEYDDIAAAQRGHCSGDYYGMAMLPAGEGTVGFLWHFWHDLPYFNGYPYGVHGHSDITLVYQEQAGDRWLHMPGRPSFISHRDVPWAGVGWIYSTSTPVEVGEEHRLYFSASNFEHMRFRGPDGQPVPRWQRWINEHGLSALTFASWPRFRLFGLQTPRDASFDLELSGLAGPCRFHLNYQTHAHGQVRVMRPAENRSQEVSRPLHGEATHAAAAWSDGEIVRPDAQGKATLTIHLERATVYAYQVSPAE